jgi:hypothetical protein
MASLHCGGGIGEGSAYGQTRQTGRYHGSTGQDFTYDADSAMATDAADRALRASGAYDLDCPEEGLVVTRLIHGNSLVEGCGKRAAYVEGDPKRQPSQLWAMDVMFYLVGIVPLKPPRAVEH